ncbi:MAG: hypothetical protein PVF17_00610 [Ignavibacteria bacterium]
MWPFLVEFAICGSLCLLSFLSEETTLWKIKHSRFALFLQNFLS